jgi:lysyl-tRNA synthetase class I
MLAQVPGVDVAERVAAEKGSALTPREAAILEEREAAARGWLSAYAPDRAVIRVHDDLPPAAAELDDAQRAFLVALADDREATPPTTGDEWQAVIFEIAARLSLPGGRAFDAIYRAFLGRPNGPRAGWLLASLAPSFVIGRLREAAGAPGTAAGTTPVGGAA